MGQVSALGTQFRRKETTIKEDEGKQKRGGWDPYHLRGTRKSSSDHAEDQPSLINSVHLCLTMISTMLTVVHALKPNSLTHSLQIYCTGLTGPISHTSWAWAAKRDPTSCNGFFLTSILNPIFLHQMAWSTFSFKDIFRNNFQKHSHKLK